MPMRIAILGAGSAGTCAALELASRGYGVDLYDERSEPIRCASYHNEGKVHLGILYAKDPSLRTADLMLEGALAFAPLLDRWIGFDLDRLTVSTPFYYGVHVGTMVNVDRLKAHYARCIGIFDERYAACKAPYLGIDSSMRVDELSRTELEALVDGDYFVTAFRTTERGVDPRRLSALLGAAMLSNPRIRFTGSARVTRVSWLDRGGLAVTFRKDGCEHTERYDHVANTLWHGRLAIDSQLGLLPEMPWMHRYKFANRVRIDLDGGSVPSITGVLGPFGDIVNYGHQGMFLSWYPEGMIDKSSDLRPPEWDEQLTPARRLDVFHRSHAEWCKRCPLLRSLTFDDADVDPGGGVIFAWGSTDLDDQHSKLHDRYDVGIYSMKNYHTVNTGKYTLSPLMGMRTAERILGRS